MMTGTGTGIATFCTLIMAVYSQHQGWQGKV